MSEPAVADPRIARRVAEQLDEYQLVEYRPEFRVDLERIRFSPYFSRLSAVTQVISQSGAGLAVHNRLTHSVKVTAVARAIAVSLVGDRGERGALVRGLGGCDPVVVQAAAAAHDLGHPPFGHSGERTLQELMVKWGGFEGNAQTLHLLTDTIYENAEGVRGMAPTRALLDGVLKYKKLFREFPAPPTNHFLYDTQDRHRAFVLGDAAIPAELHAGEKLNAFKSIECQIMDWADDAAYSLNDIVDGVRAGFLTVERIERWAADEAIDAERQRWLDELFAAIRADRLENVVSQKVGLFITSCRLRERQNFMAGRTNRFRFELVVAPAAEREAVFYKKIANDIIFESPQLQQMEHKARRVLLELWDSCWRNYVETGPRIIRILPPQVGRLIDSENTVAGKARRICDWLAGVTSYSSTMRLST